MSKAKRPEFVFERFSDLLERLGGIPPERIRLRPPPGTAKEADVIYTDVWISMGREREHARRLKVLAPYQVNRRLLSRAKPDAIVMHCLPAHRGEEISAEVLDGPQSVIIDQAENRLHMQKAILTYLLGKRSRTRR